MRMRELAIPGAAVFESVRHGDERGWFREAFTASSVTALRGRPFPVAQANCSVSQRGVIRGIHVTEVPDGQAKYVMCVAGELLDVVVDLRVGSPSFGQWASVRLCVDEPLAVYVGEGLGHGLCALTEGATALYLCSRTYRAERERRVHPLDPMLDIDWALGNLDPILAPADEDAPTLEEARLGGLLPTFEACQALADRLS